MGKHENSSQRVLDFLRERLSQGVPPSIREICAATGIKSTSTVHSILRSLEQQGIIERDRRLTRSIRLKGEKHLNIPLLGRVAAGQPILAQEYIEGYIPFSYSMAKENELFALKVHGDSMIEAGILNEDIVIVKKQPTAQNGDIVVALLEDEATVKRFFAKNGAFLLKPENPQMEPIICKEVTILGKVIASLRYY